MSISREYSKGYSKGNKDKFDVTRAENSNINKIIITYSVCEGDLGKTVETMAKAGTSVHYIITQSGVQLQLHNDHMKTFHSWIGKFKGESNNETGISIMLLNDANSSYPKEQIDKLVALVQELQAKHDIPSENVIGLNEANPKQPYSPGLLFPWDELAKNNIGHSIEIPADSSKDCKYNIGDENPEIAQYQVLLAAHGYPVQTNGTFDQNTAHYALAANIRYAGDNSSCISDQAMYIAHNLEVSVAGADSEL